MFPNSKSLQNGEDQLNIIWKCIRLAFLHFHFFVFKYDSLGRLNELVQELCHFPSLGKTKWNGSQRILVKTCCRVLNRRQREAQNSSKVPGEPHVSRFLCPLYMDSQARTLPYRFLSPARLLYYTQIILAAAGEGEMATRERERRKVVLNGISW